MSAFYAAIDAVNEDEQVLPDHRLVGVDVAVPEFDALEAHNRGEPGDRLRFCFGPYFILRSRSIAGASPCTWVWSSAHALFALTFVLLLSSQGFTKVSY